MLNAVFTEEAGNRLRVLYPADGNRRFERLVQFVGIALENREVPLVVPPEVDGDLHAVLSARDRNGRGYEVFDLKHSAMPAPGLTSGKKLNELDHPLARLTVELLAKKGFEQADAVYNEQACTLTVL